MEIVPQTSFELDKLVCCPSIFFGSISLGQPSGSVSLSDEFLGVVNDLTLSFDQIFLVQCSMVL